MTARLDGNYTCTVQTYTNSVGARVGSLQGPGNKNVSLFKGPSNTFDSTQLVALTWLFRSHNPYLSLH